MNTTEPNLLRFFREKCQKLYKYYVHKKTSTTLFKIHAEETGVHLSLLAQNAKSYSFACNCRAFTQTHRDKTLINLFQISTLLNLCVYQA